MAFNNVTMILMSTHDDGVCCSWLNFVCDVECEVTFDEKYPTLGSDRELEYHHSDSNMV